MQTNSAGDSVSLIDPATDKIVAEIPEAEVIHGAAAAPDGSRLYLTNEALDTVDVVDTQDDADHQADSADRPARTTSRFSKNGKRPTSRSRARRAASTSSTRSTQETDQAHPHSRRRAQHVHHARQQVRRGRLHRRIGGDGHRYRARAAGLVDSLRRRRAPDLLRDQSRTARPSGCSRRSPTSTASPSSTGRSARKWAASTLPDLPPAQRNNEGIQGAPAHGILIAPDGKTLWSTSKFNSAVYAYSMPDLKYLGEVKVGKVPDWITFTPDSKKMYVANAHDNTVSVIDVAARKELTKIKVGQVPKRNITAILPAFTGTDSVGTHAHSWSRLPDCALRRRGRMPGAQQPPPQPRPRRRRSTTRRSRRRVQPILMAARKGQRALPVVPFARRRQRVSRAARAGRARPTPKSRRGGISSACTSSSCRASRSRASC